MVILNLLEGTFHAVIIFGLRSDFIFKSILAHFAEKVLYFLELYEATTDIVIETPDFDEFHTITG